MIKNDLFKSDSEEIMPEEELSNEYGIPVYDYRDKEFTMLVRGQYAYREETNNRRNCYSIITNENSDVFGHNSDNMLYYGYNSFENDLVTSVLEQDSFSSDVKDGLTTKYVNRLMTSKELATNSFWYSELNIVNTKNQNDLYNSKIPDYLVVFDTIEERHIMEAKRLNIPIVLITLRKLDWQKYSEYAIPFEKDYDIYVSNRFDEERLSGKRQ